MGWNFFCLRVFANFESLSSRLQMKLYDLKLELMTSACIQNIREVVSIFLQLTKLKSQGYNSDDIYRLLVHFKDFLSSAKKFINKWLRQREILRKSFQDKVFIFKEGKFLGKRYINQGSWKLQNCNYFLVNLFPWFFFHEFWCSFSKNRQNSQNFIALIFLFNFFYLHFFRYFHFWWFFFFLKISKL